MPTAVKSRRHPCRTLLLKKREEILASVRSETRALATSIQTPDAVEFAVRAVEQDVTAVTASIGARILKEIDGALARVARGTYGVCEGCSKQIPPHRLKAIPWARFCLSCEENRSRN